MEFVTANWEAIVTLLGTLGGLFGVNRWTKHRATTHRVIEIALQAAMLIGDGLRRAGKPATDDTIELWIGRFRQALDALQIEPTSSQWTQAIDKVRDYFLTLNVIETQLKAAVGRAESEAWDRRMRQLLGLPARKGA